MCKIDAPYGNLPIDEKTDPIEHFNQALDEHQIEGNLHSLLNKHFSGSWRNVFRDTSGLEDVLSDTRRHESESEKCVAILLSLKLTLQSSFEVHSQHLPVRYNLVRDFAKDVAQSYFPDSPFELFCLGMNKVFIDYASYVSKLYGEDYCYQQAFFNDTSLAANKPYRTDILWDYFYSLAPILKSLEYDVEDVDVLKELCEIAHSSEIAGPPTKDSYQILLALDFIKAWIKFDSQSARFPKSFTQFIYSERSPWVKIESLLSKTPDSGEDFNKLKLWLEDTKLELERIFYVNAELKNASEEKIYEWANGLNYFILFNLYKGTGSSHIEPDNDYARYCEIFDEICSDLSPTQLNTWLEWSVSHDIQKALLSGGRTHSFENSSKQWLRKEYLESWKNIFLAHIHDIEYEQRLRIYSCYVTANGLQTDDFRSSFRVWWNSLLAEVITNDNFPKELFPDWTAIAIDNLGHDAALPYVEKSIGILRGKLRQAGDKQSDVDEYHSQLKKLLSALDGSSPTKALRHRLLLMRSSTKPFSDESIVVFNSFTRENTSKWYLPLGELVYEQLARQVNAQRNLSSDSRLEIERNFYIAFCTELAEFCLSRLRLRRGEKASNGKYEPNQSTEQSSTWRQGYLKAMTELGFDLNGNVHKTVNFIKKSDPEKDVREIASECYKAVRRGSKKNPSVQELKRGIISAEWWLLQCQRLELGLEINHAEALKTRRRLLRNPL